MNDEIKQYIEDILKSIDESQEECGVENRLDEDQIQIVKQLFVEKCKAKYLEYTQGKIEDYILNEVEYNQIWDDSCTLYSQSILDSLVDKGMIQSEVSADGELVYTATEFGKMQHEKYQLNIKP